MPVAGNAEQTLLWRPLARGCGPAIAAILKPPLAGVSPRPLAAAVQVPATKYEASLFLMASATTLVAWSSALRCARCLANRCSRPGMS